MKNNLLKISLGILLFSAIILSCSSDDEEQDIRRYNGELMDALTGAPISGVTIRLDHNLGGQFVMASDRAVTDDQGKFSLEIMLSEDTVTQLLEEYMFDSIVLWQGIYIESMEYWEKSKEQGGTELPQFRAIIAEDELITMTAWKCGIFNLTFMDTINTELYDNTTVEFRSKDPSEEYLYRIGNSNNQSKDWELLIPADIPIIMYWETYEGPSFDMTELARFGSLELNFEFKETQELTLYH